MGNIYDRIKERRIELNMTQEELAKKMGYKSRSSINKIELGENDIPQSKIVEFAKALGVTPAYLFGWDEEIAKEKLAAPVWNDEKSKLNNELFNSLSDEGKEAALKNLQYLVSLKESKK